MDTIGNGQLNGGGDSSIHLLNENANINENNNNNSNLKDEHSSLNSNLFEESLFNKPDRTGHLMTDNLIENINDINVIVNAESNCINSNDNDSNNNGDEIINSTELTNVAINKHFTIDNNESLISEDEDDLEAIEVKDEANNSNEENPIVSELVENESEIKEITEENVEIPVKRKVGRPRKEVQVQPEPESNQVKVKKKVGRPRKTEQEQKTVKPTKSPPKKSTIVHKKYTRACKIANKKTVKKDTRKAKQTKKLVEKSRACKAKALSKAKITTSKSGKSKKPVLTLKKNLTKTKVVNNKTTAKVKTKKTKFFAIDNCYREVRENSTDREIAREKKEAKNSKCQVFFCDKCDRVYDQYSELVYHLRRHNGEKPFACTWPGCNKAFAASNARLRHLRTHTGERPYVCPYSDCGRRFTYWKDLKLHKFRHTGEKPHKCDWEGCTSKFFRKDDLKHHRYTHTGEKPYKCKFPGCGSAFTQKSPLNLHMRKIHKNETLPSSSTTTSTTTTTTTTASIPDHTANTHHNTHELNHNQNTQQIHQAYNNFNKNNYNGVIIDYNQSHLMNNNNMQVNIPLMNNQVYHPVDTNKQRYHHGQKNAVVQQMQHIQPHDNQTHQQIHALCFTSNVTNWNHQNTYANQAQTVLSNDYLDQINNFITDGNPNANHISPEASNIEQFLDTRIELLETIDDQFVRQQPKTLSKTKETNIINKDDKIRKEKDTPATKEIAPENQKALDQMLNPIRKRANYRLKIPPQDETNTMVVIKSRPRKRKRTKTKVEVVQMKKVAKRTIAIQTSKRVLSKHPKGVPFECDICKRPFKAKHDRDCHRMTHTGEKPVACDWPGCTYRCITKSKLIRHKRRHTGEKNFVCDWPGCGKKFSTGRHVKEHKRIHTGEKPFKCDYPGCDRWFTRKDHIKNHRFTHTGERPRKCPFPGCEAAFIQLSPLKKHMELHKREGGPVPNRTRKRKNQSEEKQKSSSNSNNNNNANKETNENNSNELNNIQTVNVANIQTQQTSQPILVMNNFTGHHHQKVIHQNYLQYNNINLNEGICVTGFDAGNTGMNIDYDLILRQTYT